MDRNQLQGQAIMFNYKNEWTVYADSSHVVVNDSIYRFYTRLHVITLLGVICLLIVRSLNRFAIFLISIQHRHESNRSKNYHNARTIILDFILIILRCTQASYLTLVYFI